MKIYLVGGAVRDRLLGLPIKERDYVVVGATVNDMLQLGYRQVGKEFPVFLHPKTGEEYALARAELKVEPGYKGFVFDTSPKVSLVEDLKRRDLTINAMAEEPETQSVIDPFGGRKDIKNRLLRHVSDAFAEDPVRILRVGRFLARFAYLDFRIDATTLQLMTKMVAAGEVDALVAERVWKELSRALLEKNPEKFFEVLLSCGALTILFPTLLHAESQGIFTLPSLKALTNASELSGDPLVRFAALFYFCSKDDTKISAKKTIESLCNRYRVPNEYRKLTLLTALHYEEAFHSPALSAETLLKLFTSLDIFRREARFEQFLTVCQAIALSKHISFDREWLHACAKAAKSVDVKTIIKLGLPNKELAERIKKQRIEKIEQWLQQNKLS